MLTLRDAKSDFQTMTNKLANETLDFVVQCCCAQTSVSSERAPDLNKEPGSPTGGRPDDTGAAGAVDESITDLTAAAFTRATSAPGGAADDKLAAGDRDETGDQKTGELFSAVKADEVSEDGATAATAAAGASTVAPMDTDAAPGAAGGAELSMLETVEDSKDAAPVKDGTAADGANTGAAGGGVASMDGVISAAAAAGAAPALSDVGRTYKDAIVGGKHLFPPLVKGGISHHLQHVCF